MANRIVTATVTGETIKLSDKNAGAAGSFNAVSLALTFDSAWDGTTSKIAQFLDAYGANPVNITLTSEMLDDGAYIVPIPAEPLVYAGEMTVTVRGVDFESDGTTAERIIVSASTTMKVLSSLYTVGGATPVEPTPTQAEQLLASVNSVTGMTVTSETLASGSSATVTKTENEDGTINLDFGLPTGDQGDKGDTSTITVGTVTTGDAGSSATVTNSGTSTDAIFDFSIPKGDTGEAATIAVGTVTTGEAGSSATVTNSGTSGAAIFDFSIPQGEQGDTGNGIVSETLISGTHAAGTYDTYRVTYTDGTTFDRQVYNGADGEGAGDMLASVYDPTGKNANAFNVDNHTSGTTNKVYTAAEQTKLAGIAEGANNYTHPANHSADIIVDGTTNKAYTAEEKTKLAAISGTNTGDQTMYGLINALSAITPVTDDVIPFKDVSGSTAGYATISNILALSAGAQIETGSYTGTGTYGVANPNSITFSFAPKFVWILYSRYTLSRGEEFSILNPSSGAPPFLIMDDIPTNYDAGDQGRYPPGTADYSYAKKSADRKTLYWYSTSSASNQRNVLDYTYRYVALG